MKDRAGIRLAVLGVLAAIGASLLAVITATFWMGPNDSLAYWIAGYRLAAGLPVYAPPELAFEPYAFHYPPPVAQILAPVTVLVPALAFCIVFRVLMILALWDLAGRSMLTMLAVIAFVPVAIALRIENVELFMALGVVLGLRRWPWLFTVAALVKVSPGLGIVYLAMRRRWRDVLVSGALGVTIVGVSVAMSPDLWRASLESISGRTEMVGNSLIPVPYVVRAVAGLLMAVVAGLVGRRTGELVLVVAVTVANPGLSLQGFAVLAAAIPIWMAGPEGLGSAAEAARRDRRRRPSGELRVTAT